MLTTIPPTLDEALDRAVDALTKEIVAGVRSGLSYENALAEAKERSTLGITSQAKANEVATYLCQPLLAARSRFKNALEAYNRGAFSHLARKGQIDRLVKAYEGLRDLGMHQSLTTEEINAALKALDSVL